MPSPLRRRGSVLLQDHGHGLLPSRNNATLGPLGPLRGVLSTRQSSLHVAACNSASPRFDARLSANAGEFAFGLPWRLARAGLPPANRSALRRAHHYLNRSSELPGSVLKLIR